MPRAMSSLEHKQPCVRSSRFAGAARRVEGDSACAYVHCAGSSDYFGPHSENRPLSPQKIPRATTTPCGHPLQHHKPLTILPIYLRFCEKMPPFTPKKYLRSWERRRPCPVEILLPRIHKCHEPPTPILCPHGAKWFPFSPRDKAGMRGKGFLAGPTASTPSWFVEHTRCVAPVWHAHP